MRAEKNPRSQTSSLNIFIFLPTKADVGRGKRRKRKEKGGGGPALLSLYHYFAIKSGEREGKWKRMCCFYA